MKIDSAPRSDISPRPERGVLAEPVPSARGEWPARRERDRERKPAPAQPARRPLSWRSRERGRAVSARSDAHGRSRIGLALGLALLIIIFLLAVRTVLRPFIWAGAVTYILSPVVGYLQRRFNLRRGVSAGVIMLVLVGLMAWGVLAAVPTLESDITALAGSLDTINSYITAALPNAGTPMLFGVPISIPDLVASARQAILDLPHLVLHDSLAVASRGLGVLLHFLTFLVATFYLLLDAPRLRAWVAGRIPERAREETLAVGRQVDEVWTKYLRAEVMLIVLMTVVSLIALSALGVRFALLLAPVVGFLEIFPIIGPFFAIALVTLVALVGPANFGLTHVSYAVTVGLLFFILRQIEDYLVIPNVIGHAVKLHPVVILFALLCGATLGGILGMFLAVPVTGALKVVGNYAYDRLVE